MRGKGLPPPAPAPSTREHRKARMPTTRHGQCRNVFHIGIRYVYVRTQTGTETQQEAQAGWCPKLNLQVTGGLAGLFMVGCRTPVCRQAAWGRRGWVPPRRGERAGGGFPAGRAA